MNNPTSQIFSAHAKILKITSASKSPFEISNGRCELSKKGTTYVWSMCNQEENKLRRFQFRTDGNTSIKVTQRGVQFTIHVKISNVVTQLIGTFNSDVDCEKLCSIFKDIGSKKQPSTAGKWLTAKENCTILKTNTPNKSSPLTPNRGVVRAPLSDKSMSRGTSDRSSFPDKKKVFPSPTEFTQTSSITEQSEPNLTALGEKKTGTFYNSNNVRHKELNLSVKKNLTCNSVSSSMTLKHSSLTFQNRNYSPKESENLGTEVIGFSNLGNTCYMNAILQCLLNIPNFFQDLNNCENLDIVEHNSLYNSLCNLGILKYSFESLENQRYALKRVKSAISESAKRFSGYSQHDAHEFLCHCLDQLKEDLSMGMRRKYEAQGFDLSSSEFEESDFFACPIKMNFESTILHGITCKNCNEQVLKTEVCHDFSLVIPDFDENCEPKDRSIDELLKMHFMDEIIEYTCETCNTSSAILTHQFKKLPRVLIMHIKRYDIYDTKRSDRIPLPKSIDLNFLVSNDDTVLPRPFAYDKDRLKSIGIKSLLNGVTPQKRKSEEPLQNGPLHKLSKISDHIDLSIEKECKNDDQDFEKNIFGSTKKNYSFVRTESSTPQANKKLEFNAADGTNSKLDDGNLVNLECDNEKFEKSLTHLTSVSDDEEDELRKALELSMKEFNEKHEQDFSEYASNQTQGGADAYTNIMSYKDTESKSDELDIIESNNINKRHLYKLVGIVNHHGFRTTTGHYTSDSFDFKSKKWRSYNDSSVKEIKEHEARYGS